MNPITDEDIALFMNDENFREILNSIHSEIDTQGVIVNVVLYLFNNSMYDSQDDWIRKIINIINTINNNKNKHDILAPCLRNVNIDISLSYIVDRLVILANHESLYYENVCITHEVFNEFIETLYVWFKNQ